MVTQFQFDQETIAFTEYSVSEGSGPLGITAGPAHDFKGVPLAPAVWFTESALGKVGRITTDDGMLKEYSGGNQPISPDSAPFGITVGADRLLWFTEEAVTDSVNKVASLSPGDEKILGERYFPVIAEFPLLPPAGKQPVEITAGSDGNLWFTESAGNKIGRITPNDESNVTIKEFPLPPGGETPLGITSGPDGNLWFTFGDATGAKIGRMDTSGMINGNFFSNIGASLITAGPDGNLWFTADNNIGRITPSGMITPFPLPRGSGGAGGITTGPDGAVWFTDFGGAIGRITANGKIVEFSVPTADGSPTRITLGPDNNLWFTELTGSKIGKAQISFPMPPQPFTCTELGTVRGAFGGLSGQPGFDPRADVNNDGIVDVRDLAFVARRLPVGVNCP